jgi:xanthine dehydrogenase molybdopterin-binding subunit B
LLLPQTCLCIPGEEEMEVFAATQYTDNDQTAIAQVLNIPQKKYENKVWANVSTI